MAKKKKVRISLTRRYGNVTTLPVVDKNGLLPYTRYIDSQDHKYRVFFEEPLGVEEVTEPKYPDKKFLRAGKYSKGQKNGFLIVRDGKVLVGEDIAKTFAQLVIKKMSEKDMSKHTVNNVHCALNDFFSFLASMDSPPRLFVQISSSHVSRWLDSLPPAKAKRQKAHLKVLTDLNTATSDLNLSSIRIKEDNSSVTTPDKPLSDIDFDKIVDNADYSDRELMQILAYSFYEIERGQQQFDLLESLSEEALGDDYIPLEDMNTENATIRLLLESGTSGHRQLFKQLCLLIKNQTNESRVISQRTNSSHFVTRLTVISKRLYQGQYNPFDDFRDYLNSLSWWQGKSDKSSSKKTLKVDYEKLALKSSHHEVAILIYALVITGVNLEVARSWKWRVNGKPWYENYDIQLGITSKTAPRDKTIALVGVKTKGQQAKRAKKSIVTPVNVNSPLVGYLKFLDKTRPADREFIFTITGDQVPRMLKGFATQYPIIGDDNKVISSLETKRFRKVFAGHELIRLLKDVKSPDELITRLKEALSHGQFDTTLFSYILKSGVGNLVLNSAIVTLTNDLLEKAMSFRGEIKEDDARSSNTHHVFLCDCSDPSNPTHDLPIADQCRKYDMCLGCERSEVYSEHLPAICYRMLQYEERRSADPEMFKVTLEDRLHIAHDTISQFKIRHSNGLALVENAYVEANEAMANNTPLLPPILQTGAI